MSAPVNAHSAEQPAPSWSQWASDALDRTSAYVDMRYDVRNFMLYAVVHTVAWAIHPRLAWWLHGVVIGGWVLLVERAWRPIEWKVLDIGRATALMFVTSLLTWGVLRLLSAGSYEIARSAVLLGMVLVV